MAKKKKKTSGSGAMIIAIMLICVMAVIWYISSGDSGFLSFKDESNSDISSNTDEDNVANHMDTDNTENDNQDNNTDLENDTSTDPADNTVEETPTPEDTTLDQSGFDMTIDTATLSNDMQSWSWRRNTDHEPVEIYSTFSPDELKALGTYYMVDTEEKVVYLTFDEGYENGYTESILDTLLAYNVKAAFFVTKTYIESRPDLVIRMKEEGHIVGNHSATHPDFTTLTDEEIETELISTADTMAELTGYDMDMFLRPPEATYSERTLYVARRLGYRNIFYSIAYQDWLVDDQLGAEAALDHVMTNYHKGAIILLHAVSSSNAEALGDMISELQALGYRFGYLYEVE